MQKALNTSINEEKWKQVQKRMAERKIPLNKQGVPKIYVYLGQLIDEDCEKLDRNRKLSPESIPEKESGRPINGASGGTGEENSGIGEDDTGLEAEAE